MWCVKMSERIEVKIRCPFFTSLIPRRINCEKLNDDMKAVSLFFDSNKKRDEYIGNFCGSKCMKSCPIYQINEEKYNEEEKNNPDL